MILGWIWLAIIFIAVIIEAFTHKKIAVVLIPGSIVGIVMDFFDVDILIQILTVFLLVAIGTFLYFKPFRKNIGCSAVGGGIESIVGEKCVVVERIDNFAGCGEVRVNGQIWSARGVGDDDEFDVGEILNIVAIEGVKLICKK